MARKAYIPVALEARLLATGLAGPESDFQIAIVALLDRFEAQQEAPVAPVAQQEAPEPVPAPADLSTELEEARDEIARLLDIVEGLEGQTFDLAVLNHFERMAVTSYLSNEKFLRTFEKFHPSLKVEGELDYQIFRMLLNVFLLSACGYQMINKDSNEFENEYIKWLNQQSKKS